MRVEKRCYGATPPGMDISKLRGALIVLEGPDSSGRTTHIRLLGQWLGERGYPVEEMGLKRSALVARDLDRAKDGNVLSPRTMSLFYATDFYDQLENRIIPALRAGSVVLSDRYIFTLIARAKLRGGNTEWLETLYSMALVPDAVYNLAVSSNTLVERTLAAHGTLGYWESGMDLGLSRDWFTSFGQYQRKLRAEFDLLRKKYQFDVINANRSIDSIQRDLRARIDVVLETSYLT
jgi:dTMP kinase